jgi:biopolymer transport protein ExbD
MAFGASSGSGSGGGSGAGVRSDINVTPLIDVVLVLLIIFIVMTPPTLKQMELAVPEKADVKMATPTTTTQVVVSISREGRIAINHEPITESNLTQRIHDLMANSTDKLAFFDVDDEANYGDAMHVMDVCRGAGVKTLGIMTK